MTNELIHIKVYGQNLEDMKFELLDEENGLSNHWITQLAIDSSGYLWISTRDGLNRYDGHVFKTFRHDVSDSTSLLRNSFQNILIDRHGNVWIGYNAGGLSRYVDSCQCFVHYHLPADKNLNATVLIRIGEDSTVWTGGRGFGLNIIDLKTMKNRHFNLPDIDSTYSKDDQIGYNSVGEVYQENPDQFLIATANGLYRFKYSTGQFTYIPYRNNDPKITRNDYFTQILPDQKEGLWMATFAGGLCHYSIKDNQFHTYKYDVRDFHNSVVNVIYKLQHKNDHEIWVTTSDRGFGVFNKLTGSFQFFDQKSWFESGLSSTNVSSCYLTKDHVMFLVNDDGLLKYNPYASLFQFKSLQVEKSQGGNGFLINKIIDDSINHCIYFATSLGGGFQILDKKNGDLKSLQIEVRKESNFGWMQIFDMTRDTSDNIWLATRDFLYQYNTHKKILRKISEPFASKRENDSLNLFYLIQDKNHRIWLVTTDGGLFQFNPETRKFSNRLNSSQNLQNIQRYQMDNTGRIWFYGEGKIGFLDPFKNQIDTIESNDTIRNYKEWVKGIGIDHDGNIWVAIIGKGILKINEPLFAKPKYSLLGTREGLPNDRIYNMSSDENGNFWMSTVSGVVLMNPIHKTYRILDQAVGMDKHTIAMNFINSGPNEFYITTPGRYCRVNFDNLSQSTLIPKAYIDIFRVLNKERPGDFNSGIPLVLKPGEDLFSFEFGCVDFTRQVQNTFAYMLEGWDKEWVFCGKRRYANYTNLNGGTYTFKVKAANSEGQWGPVTQIPIIIGTAFYKKSWFALLISFVFASLIYTLYKFRVQQIKKSERIKTEFNKQLAESKLLALRAQMNPHFIFNCLNSINRYIIKSDIKTSSLYVTRFAKLIRLILDNSEHKNVVLTNELEALQLYMEMESLRFDHKFSFEIRVDPDVDTSNISIPPLIIQPYVENAIWHGLMQKETKGHLEIHISQTEEFLICEITDNGIGREKSMEYKSKNAPTRKSLGMKLTEARLQLTSDHDLNIGSQKIIDLYDEHGQASGTKVIISIPI